MILEYQGVEVDHCGICHGTWLDGGELSLIAGDPGIGQCVESVLADQDPMERSPMRCPRCRRRLERVCVTTDSEDIVYERCPTGCGLFFKKGQLNSVGRVVGGAQGESVQQFIHQLFGYEMNKSDMQSADNTTGGSQ